MSSCTILVVGQGGREHALAWQYSRSELVERIIVSPGNPGTAILPKTSNLNIGVTDIDALIAYAVAESVDLIVPGPEAALAAGIADAAAIAGIPCLGPTQAAAQLESSKTFAKEFMQQHGIPTAKYAQFHDLDKALNYISTHPYPLVIKADGLAAGKGVVIAQNKTEAQDALTDMLINNRFGEAGSRVVIEEFLVGSELSFIALCDGSNIVPLDTSRDHKHRFEGDTGPNTGGMGAVSPVPISNELRETIEKDIMMPVISAMAKVGTPYVGFLYAGLMIDQNNEAKVLEFNCRLGDPEAQALLARLDSDLTELSLAAVSGQLSEKVAHWKPQAAVAVVMASKGYPEKAITGTEISQEKIAECTETLIFHSGTKKEDGQLKSAGGRVLAVTALGETVAEAQKKAYLVCDRIKWPDCVFRTDIGHSLVEQ